MPNALGKTAAVVGAGMGGLCAARALADHFEQIFVFERDELPQEAIPRLGAGQSKHTHALLVGGQRALCQLFPGFDVAMEQMGAVELRAGLDVLVERPGFDPFPQRDLNIKVYSMSRPLIELATRRLLQKHANVTIRDTCRVESFVATPDESTSITIEYKSARGKADVLPADLVIDASGRGVLTLELLQAMGRPPPEETKIGVELTYATAIFSIPKDAPRGYKGAFLFPDAPGISRAGLLLPIEGNRWILTLVGRQGDKPPTDYQGFLAFAESLRTATIFDAVKGAELLRPITPYGFLGSVKRHFERIADFPRGFLPLGDALCRFNPVYGQGMSVAAQEACLLRELLDDVAGKVDPLAKIADSYFAAAAALLEAPWSSALLDLIYPETTGLRPPDFEERMKFGVGLIRLAAQDPGVHKLFYEVNNLIKPASVYRDAELQRRVMAALGEG